MNKRICIFMVIAALMLCMIGCSKQPTNTDQPNDQDSTQETAPTGNEAGQENKENKEETNGVSQSTNDQNAAPDGDTPVSNDGGKVEQSNNTPQGNNAGSGATSENKENVGNSNGTDGNNTVTVPNGNSNSGTVTTVPEKTEDCSYEEYHAMTPEAQQKFFNKFESVEAFFVWYNAAKAKYEKDNAAIEIGGGGQIDLGEVIGGGK